MNAIENITIGHTERLRKPVGYTMLANLVNIVPFCLSIEAINVIFRAFDGQRNAAGHSTALDYFYPACSVCICHGVGRKGFLPRQFPRCL